MALTGVCLAVAIPLSLIVYAGESPSADRRTVAIVGASALSTAVSVALILAYSSWRWAYNRRRRPLVWLAVRVLAAAASTADVSVRALGLISRDGDLVISLPRRRNDFVREGDSFLAFRVYDKGHLGIVSVTTIEQDSYLCMVTDRMDAQDFWSGLEFRMMSDFSPPAGVEFSRHIDQIDMDFARRLIRSWGG